LRSRCRLRSRWSRGPAAGCRRGLSPSRAGRRGRGRWGRRRGARH